ncbi:MAG: phosphonoacetaldehyde reductase [Lachnospiraceae bacterium]|nr:phosphonoacetaldehyde reductase [Lachnospiraceae bacterium]
MVYIEGDYKGFDRWIYNHHIQRILLICGKNVEYHPLFRHMYDLKGTIGTDVVRFSDFTPNPKYESAVEGVDLFREKGCDSILAMGGGSTMDLAKCIKLFATMDAGRNFLEQRIEGNNIPLMVIPTTAGTGSEVTRYAVLYYNGIKQSITHEDCIPTSIFMDPSFLETVSPYHRKATFLDALCHSIESFWSVNSTEESRAYSKEAIALLLGNKDAYLKNERLGNVNIQRASQLAGKAINITQTTAGHAMCYMLTSLYGLAHGHAAAICVNELWPYMLDHTADCRDKRGERFLISTLRELATAFECDTPKEASLKFSLIFSEMDLGKPVCRNRDDIESLVENVKPERLKNHPVYLSSHVLGMLYQRILKS